MEKTRKEVLTKENIVKDLLKAENQYGFYKGYNYLAFMISIILFSFVIGIFNIYLGVVIFLFTVYPLIKFIQETRLSKMRKQAIKNGDFTISTEKLINIGEESSLETNTLSQRSSRTVSFLYFSCQKWKIPTINYTWSDLYKMSEAGIKNTSLIGNEFYVVTDNSSHEIGCVYNTKFFEATKENKGV